MTPHQGDSPGQPRGRQPSGNEYQQPPARQPQQPPTGQFQGQPPQGQQGQPPMQRTQGMTSQGQGQPMQGQPPQAPPQQGGISPQIPSQGAPPQGNFGTQPQQGPPGGTQMGQQGGRPARGGRPQRTSGMRMRPIRVEEIVEEDVVTAERDTPISTVVAKMAEKGVGSVVVVENDQPVGIITDRKIALSLEGTPDIANKQAGDLIGGDLITATTSMSIFDALQQLSDEKIRRLPIVDDNGNLQGIITLDDILVL